MHPNNIGISLVELANIKDNIITIKGVDILDGTPLLDIKPYVESFDIIEAPIKNGWAKVSKEEILKKDQMRGLFKFHQVIPYSLNYISLLAFSLYSPYSYWIHLLMLISFLIPSGILLDF